MEWIEKFLPHGSVAGGLATLSIAVTLGLALGAVRVRGVRLGVAAVFFSSLALSAAGLSVSEDVLRFLRDFALILFVYTIGLQVGPSFVSSLRAEGVRLNLCALATLLMAALIAAGLAVGFHLRAEAASGLFTGGVATSPGLAAGQGAIMDRLRKTPPDAAATARSMGVIYAITYPFGLVGPITMIIVLRRIFRVRVEDELRALKAAEAVRRPPIGFVDVEVTRAELAGSALREHELIRSSGVVLSRMMRGTTVTVPNGETRIEVGDVYRVVGRTPAVSRVLELLGRRSTTDVGAASGDIQRIRLVVTHRIVIGETLRELDLISRFGVTITRVTRAGVDLTPRAELSLKFGDHVTAVGPPEGLKAIEAELGNSMDVLNRPQLIPIFLGIVLGVLVGSVPLALPGMHSGIRIGLAGGPMLVAIFLSRLGNIGRIVWYMPDSARNLFRDFGLAVFLACIGLEAGHGFVGMLVGGHGWTLLALGAIITIVPVLIVAVFARVVLKMNFVTLCGMIAGMMTSSPTLMFANDLTGSTAPSLAYAAVYPLSMLTPVFCAQILVTAMM